MNVQKSFAGIAGLAALVSGCSTTPTTSTRVTYDNTIRHLIDEHCSQCHGIDAPTAAEFKADRERYKKDNLGPRMDTYDNLMVTVNGGCTGAVMRRLDDGANTEDGKPGNMYKYLGKDDAQRTANLALFKNWIGIWNLKRAKDITEEERKGVIAPRN
jgi:mono/diheme cytochrome c family protein